MILEIDRKGIRQCRREQRELTRSVKREKLLLHQFFLPRQRAQNRMRTRPGNQGDGPNDHPASSIFGDETSPVFSFM